jgi:uncharacterized protein involved in type VI secretion and phage assembly
MTMATLFEWGTEEEAEGRPGASIALGTVTNNLDLLTEGKVLVRVTAIDQEVWARLAAPGAGSGAGFFYVPRIDDEVLVAFAGDDPTDGFIVGGLWNDRDRIPVSDPVSALAKRIIRSGVTAGTGHEIELDDTEQSVTITTSTKQKITMDPGKIELTNLAGTVKITLDNAGQSVSITAAASLKLEAPQITLKGATVEVNGTAMTTVKSGAAVNVTAPMVKIN